MGFFDFLRKLAQDNEKEKPKQGKVSISDLKEWTEKKMEELKKEEKETLLNIQKQIESLADGLKEKIKAAESFDINAKKEEDRIKTAVEDGRKKYLASVGELMKNLGNLKKESLEKAIADSDRIFSDFNRISRTSYERATILIGKEMVEIRENLKTFSKGLITIFNENKKIVESFRTVFFVKLKLSQLERIEQEIKNIDKEILSINEKVTEKEKESKDIFDEIERIKESPEYQEKKEKQEKINKLKNEIEKDISDLRQLIDFKALANFHHIFEDKIQIVKAHRDDFQKNFKKDDGKSIMGLLETAKLNNKDISGKVEEMNKKKEEILELEKDIENGKNKDKENELQSNSTKTVIEIGDLKNKKAREEKRLEKIKEDKEKTLGELKKSLQELGIELT